MPTLHFVNSRQCKGGKLIASPLTVDVNGVIIPNSPLPQDVLEVDLKNAIVSPGFLELQINGALGFHFASYKDPESYEANVRTLAQYLPSTGVTGFYATVPTVPDHIFHSVLPLLKPKDAPEAASVLGAHVEGPFLSPYKKGAHDAGNLYVPADTSLEAIYGKANLIQSVRLVTVAPELKGAMELIKALRINYDIQVSMGHSAATLEEGMQAMEAGAKLLTHCFNAMNPLHHREPGLVGLIAAKNPPFFSIIADSIHIHPRVVSLAYRSSPNHCILITDSIELSGLPDGVHPGHAQIPWNQVKAGNKVTIENTDTLTGTCIGLDECVRNLMTWTGISIAEAVRCVTENVAEAMNLHDRGRLEVGHRADFVLLGDDGIVKETWILGKRIV